MSKKVPKRKLTIIRVQWLKGVQKWRVKWVDPEHGEMVSEFDLKEDADWWARDRGNVLKSRGFPAQRLLYNKNGQIGKGRNAEASYGCDSKSPG